MTLPVENPRRHGTFAGCCSRLLGQGQGQVWAISKQPQILKPRVGVYDPDQERSCHHTYSLMSETSQFFFKSFPATVTLFGHLTLLIQLKYFLVAATVLQNQHCRWWHYDGFSLVAWPSPSGCKATKILFFFLPFINGPCLLSWVYYRPENEGSARCPQVHILSVFVPCRIFAQKEGIQFSIC